MKCPKRLLPLAVLSVSGLAGCDDNGPTRSGSDSTVLEGDFSVRSQEDLDLLAARGGGSFGITGDLTVEDSPFTTLEALENLTSIGGNLSIGSFGAGNADLTSLTGLDNLTRIGGYLSIFGNTSLTSLEGLEGVIGIGGSLFIRNTSLTSLAGLENVSGIGGKVNVVNNDALTSLGGLDNLASIGGFLSIVGNDSLTSLTGLGNLTGFGGDLVVHDNPALTSLSGLERITSIDGDAFDRASRTVQACRSWTMTHLPPWRGSTTSPASAGTCASARRVKATPP